MHKKFNCPTSQYNEKDLIRSSSFRNLKQSADLEAPEMMLDTSTKEKRHNGAFDRKIWLIVMKVVHP